MIRYTVVTGWRSPVDGVAGLGGLTVQTHCLSGYSHYPPPQPPAQLSPNQRVMYKAQELQVMGNIFVVTKVSTLLIITRVSSGLKKSQMYIFSKYKYLHVQIASLANVKSCVTVGPISLVANVWSCIVLVD